MRVKNSNPSLPIYAMLYSSSYYPVYAELLKLDLNIQGADALTAKIQNGDVPRCFWLLDAHHKGIFYNRIETYTPIGGNKL